MSQLDEPLVHPDRRSITPSSVPRIEIPTDMDDPIEASEQAAIDEISSGMVDEVLAKQVPMSYDMPDNLSNSPTFPTPPPSYENFGLSADEETGSSPEDFVRVEAKDGEIDQPSADPTIQSESQKEEIDKPNSAEKHDDHQSEKDAIAENVQVHTDYQQSEKVAEHTATDDVQGIEHPHVDETVTAEHSSKECPSEVVRQNDETVVESSNASNEGGETAQVETPQEVSNESPSPNPFEEVQIGAHSHGAVEETNVKVDHPIPSEATAENIDNDSKENEQSSEATQSSKAASIPRRCYESARKRCSII